MREKLNIPEWTITLATSLAVAMLLILTGCASVDPMYQPAQRKTAPPGAQLCEVRIGSNICRRISRDELQEILDVLSPR